MKTNLTYLSQETFINKDKQTVVVKLTSEIDLEKIPNMEVYIQLPEVQEVLSNYPYVFDEEYDYTGALVFETIGKSAVMPDSGDVFDEETGRRIALTKAQSKAFLLAEKFYNDITSAVYASIDHVGNLMYGAFTSYVKCNKHIAELGNTEK